jgi:hypothetical protein
MIVKLRNLVWDFEQRNLGLDPQRVIIRAADVEIPDTTPPYLEYRTAEDQLYKLTGALVWNYTREM